MADIAAGWMRASRSQTRRWGSSPGAWRPSTWVTAVVTVDAQELHGAGEIGRMRQTVLKLVRITGGVHVED